MNESLINKISEYWNLSKDQLQEIYHPIQKVYKNEAFSNFLMTSKKVMICGDYDCDGVVSTTISALLCEKLGISYGYYIPNRLTEGYGVSINTVQMAFDKGYTDLLIVDTGVKEHEAINLALKLGMDVAVVDHHLLDKDLPSKVTLVHPDLIDDKYFDTMSAGGLMAALAEGMGLLDDYILSLGSLATVADVMPLWGKNRELVIRGLNALNHNQFLQFDALVKRNRYTHYTAEFLAFQVSPKINSVGRMADIVNINNVVKYFLTDSPQIISGFAKQVLNINTKRKQLGKELQIEAERKINGDPIQIIKDKNFHEGLLGIVANHIANKSEKPTIVLRELEDTYKGSARSSSVSLQELFKQIDSKYFVAMGGHDFAYGMTIKKEHYESFKNDLLELMKNYDSKPIEFSGIDVFDFEFSPNIIKKLKQFEPLGEGLKLPTMRMKMPSNYNIVRLNGHGYKIVFNEGNISEALYFTQDDKIDRINQAEYLIFRLDMQSKWKIKVFVEELI